ncbi:hypothetical protein KIN20_013266 [Parelaphostrongylus tenuis]|uniref:Uncharacterized protein n=1 Tax=Parelaphostrongylus tenuis TaxID=148309 RepID=A0AAD5QKX3_PARTN|nr:hypothetical protein KIN20_013266 [Parelaphostrongylus tenuis]
MVAPACIITKKFQNLSEEDQIAHIKDASTAKYHSSEPCSPTLLRSRVASLHSHLFRPQLESVEEPQQYFRQAEEMAKELNECYRWVVFIDISFPSRKESAYGK